MNKNSYLPALKGAFSMMTETLPIVIGMVFLIGLLLSWVPEGFYARMFLGNAWIDAFTGAVFGSVSAGNPVNSYIIGGELAEDGVSMVAIIAFIVSWVTVGVVQLPAEIVMLGKGFAIIRNAIAFVSAICIAIIVSYFI